MGTNERNNIESVRDIVIAPGMKIGKLSVVDYTSDGKWHCICNCGRHSFPLTSNLLAGRTHSCGNCGKNIYSDCEDGTSVKVTATNGEVFYIDKKDEPLVRKYKWHICINKKSNGYQFVITSDRILLAQLLMGFPKNVEIDHIDLDPLNNRRENLRLVTHQQNQINQPLQKNNTSGVSGVSFYPPRNKYRARIKIGQHDLHLGYYSTFEEAVQARNVGVECMFGEYGRYNDVPSAPEWIRKYVTEKCKRFAELSVCRAFLRSVNKEDGDTNG